MNQLKKIRGHKLIKVPEAQIPGDLKLSLEEHAKTLIENTLKPAFMTSPPENNCRDYIADIYAKWEDHYFYFCAGYRCSPPNSGPATAAKEYKFARLDYVGDVRFNLSYMSHQGKWEKIFIDLTVPECMEALKNESFFYPWSPHGEGTVRPGRERSDT